MIIGVFPEQGGSITSYKKSGQDRRFVDNYLGRYSANFDKVYFFSYADENPTMPESCELLPNKWRLHRWIYAVSFPFLYIKKLRACSLVRLMQATGEVPAIIAKLLFQIPVVVTFGYRYSVHSRLDGAFIRPFIFKLRERIALGLSDSVIVTADSMYRYIKRYVREDKILFVPNGVDTALFSPADTEKTAGKKIIITVGGLRRQKNQRLLIKAVSLIDEPVRLKIIGQGPLRKELQEYASENGVDVEFVGVIEHEQLPQHLNRADVFVLSSYSEGHPKTLLEAMSCGLPCVGTNIDGIRDVITDGVSGALCDLNAHDFAAKIKLLLNDTSHAHEMGRNAREVIKEKYELDVLIHKEISHFKDIAVRKLRRKAASSGLIARLRRLNGWADLKHKVSERMADRLWGMFTRRGRRVRQIVDSRKDKVSAMKPLDFPDTLHIELTNRCNLRCQMCSYPTMAREKKDMDFDMFKSVIDQCVGRNIDAISLYYFGEALLNRDLEKAVAYVAERLPGVHTRVRTNAQLLDAERAKAILESPLTSLEFSVDGLTKESYEDIMRGAQYEVMRNNIEGYFSIRKKLRKKQQNLIVTIAMDETEADMKKFVKKWSAFSPVSVTRRHEGFITAGSEKGGHVRGEACPEVFYHAMILSNGDVSFCCCDVEGALSIGNVSQASLYDIWNSERANEIRASHSRRDFTALDICAGCSGGILRQGVVRR